MDYSNRNAFFSYTPDSATRISSKITTRVLINLRQRNIYANELNSYAANHLYDGLRNIYVDA